MAIFIRIWTVLVSLAAVAGANDFHEAPRPPESIPWGPMGVAVLAAVAIGVVAFKKSGRTHLD